MFQGSKTILGVDEHVSLHVTMIMLKILSKSFQHTLEVHFSTLYEIPQQIL